MVGGRTRKPTIRALESAEARLALKRASSPSHASSASSSHSQLSTQSAPVKRNGRAQNDKGREALAMQALLTQAGREAMMLDGEGDGEDELPADADDEGASGVGGSGAEEQDLTLYCVCLGYDTGEQPMIQCEHCSNWFHFSCVGLTDEIASKIEAYSCDMCEQMGMGSTRLLDAAPTQLLALPPSAFAAVATSPSSALPPPPVGADGITLTRDEDGHYDLPTSGEEDFGEDEDLEEATDEEDEDFEEKDDRAEKRKRNKRGRREADEEWNSDEEDGGGEKKAKRPPRKKRPSAPRLSSSESKPKIKGPVQSVPTTDKTRSTVIKQLTNLFSSIFSASTAAGQGSATGLDVRSIALAEEVEGELFEAFAELDDKAVIRMPRNKYATKFRSLAYNLKTNAVLRSRVAASELSPNRIANLSADDLQTPELRAMAEAVRAASLKHSVKEALAAPTRKLTHKGEEEIESEASRVIAAEEAERTKEQEKEKEQEETEERDRKRSESVSLAGSPSAAAFPGTPTAGSPSGTPQSPSNRDSPFFPSSSTSRARSSLAFSTSADDRRRAVDAAASPARSGTQGSPPPPGGARSPAATGSPLVSEEIEGEMSPPPAPSERRRTSSSFNMASIWGKVKGASPPVEEKPVPALEDTNPASDGVDPFDFSIDGGKKSDDDFDEDDLFRDPNASPKKQAPPRPPTPPLENLPSVWTGDVLVPDEGGFPSFAVQVGGRPLGVAPSTWSKLLPRRNVSVAGRLATQQATKYLSECSFAPKRELIILSLLPDLSGPTSDHPQKPVRDRCLAKHKHVVDLYRKKDRIAVVQPAKEVRELVKDIYLVPLAVGQELPEYVDLAEEHCIPEGAKRKEDLLLCVLVVQKGVLPTVKTAPPVEEPPTPVAAASAPPIPTGPAALAGIPTGPRAMQPQQASPPPPSSAGGYSHSSFSPPPPHHAPPPHAAPPAGFDHSSVHNLLSGLDSSALSSLLANPALMGALGGGNGAPLQPAALAGYFPHQQNPQPYDGYVPPGQPHLLEGGGHGASGSSAGGMHPARLAMMNQGMDSSLSSGSAAPAGAPGLHQGGMGSPAYGRDEAFGMGDGGWNMRAQQQQQGQGQGQGQQQGGGQWGYGGQQNQPQQGGGSWGGKRW
ncbi:hypothetical protein JCM11251_005482 [Rhodosporidiobolus azoricus]